MSTEERKEYTKFLKFIKQYTKHNKNTKGLCDNLSDDGVQKICRCIWSILYQPQVDTICKRGSKHKAQELTKLLSKHKTQIKKLAKHSTKKKDIGAKREIIRGRGFPLLPILAIAIPSLISLMKK